MFLDENGRKISSSRGGGFGVDDWLGYAPLDSLAWFVQKSPQKATKIHAGVIPRAVDDWLDALRDFNDADSAEDRRDNPLYLIAQERLDAGADPDDIGLASDVTYQMLLNVIGALNVDEPELVWKYVERYDERAARDRELIDELIEHALAYYEDHILPDKEYRQPPEDAVPAILQFRDFLREHPDADAETIQNQAYQAGKDHDLSLGNWFQSVYRLLLGQDQGPRVGSFVDMVGIDETIDMIDDRLDETGD
jgi:lysyl-tRNA synthetase class 1